MKKGWDFCKNKSEPIPFCALPIKLNLNFWVKRRGNGSFELGKKAEMNIINRMPKVIMFSLCRPNKMDNIFRLMFCNRCSRFIRQAMLTPFRLRRNSVYKSNLIELSGEESNKSQFCNKLSMHDLCKLF